MSAIRLPVKVVPYGLDWWVTDSNDTAVTTCLKREPADKIALALNLHNELINALKPFAAVSPTSFGSIPDEQSWLWKPSQTSKELPGISIAHIKQAKAILARAETDNKTDP